jgi:dihydrolipoamide dehydrogenase
MNDYDMAVIGGGPGGYVAAIRGAQLGLSVVLIEKENLGGICLNWGCIPTKSLLSSAKVIKTIKESEHLGIQTDNLEINLDKIFKNSRSASDKLVRGVAYLLEKNNVTVIKGEATLLSSSEIKIINENSLVIKSDNIVLATGAHARKLDGMETDGERVWDYKDALKGLFLPKNLLVVGSGAIGMEFASFYNSVGSNVTVIESMERILLNEDIEVSKFAKKSFEKNGIKIILNSKLKKITKGTNFINALIDGASKSIKYDAVLIAIGISGNSNNLGLERLGVELDGSHVKVDEFCATNIDGIYAIGDLAGAPWLAHKASHEGAMVAELISGKQPHHIKKSHISNCTYSQPEIASIGLTEEQALDLDIRVKVGNFPFIGNGKAVVLGETEGFVKTIFNAETGEFLGAHMVGPNVTELISVFAVGLGLEITEEDFANTIIPHPTLSEAIHESALSALERTIHY